MSKSIIIGGKTNESITISAKKKTLVEINGGDGGGGCHCVRIPDEQILALFPEEED